MKRIILALTGWLIGTRDPGGGLAVYLPTTIRLDQFAKSGCFQPLLHPILEHGCDRTMRSNRLVGKFQAAVLAVLEQAGGPEYGTHIGEMLRVELSEKTSDAQVYLALQRLRAAGYVDLAHAPDREDAPSVRGRPRRYYQLTADGLRALQAARSAYETQVNRLRVSERKEPTYGALDPTSTPALVG